MNLKHKPICKTLGRGINHTPILTSKLKKERSCTSISLYAIKANDGVNFTFTGAGKAVHARSGTHPNVS
jgi:hypothetical protein